ncbi:hypothetical protein EJB05_00816, partial [Eragrostis curvula]
MNHPCATHAPTVTAALCLTWLPGGTSTERYNTRQDSKFAGRRRSSWNGCFSGGSNLPDLIPNLNYFTMPVNVADGGHKMTEKCGSGLVAEDEIKKGEFVIEYVGEVIDDRTCEQRLWKMRRQGHTNFYLCEVSSNMIIDATNKGNMSRFINHSCEPNTEMQKWSVDGETRVGIFALRNIKKGEELTYDYNLERVKIVIVGLQTAEKCLAHLKRLTQLFFTTEIQEAHRLCLPGRKEKHTVRIALGRLFGSGIHEKKCRPRSIFCDYSLEKFNLKEEEWHFLPDNTAETS